MGHEVKAEKRNWYSEDALGEKRIGPAGSVVCCSIISVSYTHLDVYKRQV